MPPLHATPELADSDDADLLRRYARKDDVAAMDVLVLRHAESLRAFLRGWVSDKATVEDLFQETWARVLQAPERFHNGNFRAWLLHIARNLVIDRHRRSAPDLVLDAPVTEEEDAPTLAALLPDETTPAPDILVERHDLRERILEAVHALPAAQREIFLLRAEGVPFADIAQRLRIPLNTALGRMHYAMGHLQKALFAFHR